MGNRTKHFQNKQTNRGGTKNARKRALKAHMKAVTRARCAARILNAANAEVVIDVEDIVIEEVVASADPHNVSSVVSSVASIVYSVASASDPKSAEKRVSLDGN